MIKYIFSLLCIILSGFAFTQNSLNVETEYLKLILVQKNSELAADNYRNAELVADSVIYKQSKNKNQVSNFFIELAKSYNLNNDYNMVALSILRQQFLFANKNQDILAKDLFFDACYKLNIKKEKIQEIYNLKEKINSDFKNNMLLFLQASIMLNKKELNKINLRYSNFYKTLTTQYPYWLHQWEFFTKIRVKNKKIISLIAFDKINTEKKLIDYLSDKQQKYVLLKAEKYYRKNKALNQAKYYLQQYKSKDLSFIEKIIAFNRKVLILTPII